MEVIPSEGARELSTSEDPIFTELLDLSPEYYVYATPTKENSTSCAGDSGGPLFTLSDGKMSLFAINSAVFPNKNIGADRCNRGYLHLITPVAPYADWLKAKIANWKP